jgi:hypothetical protein
VLVRARESDERDVVVDLDPDSLLAHCGSEPITTAALPPANLSLRRPAGVCVVHDSRGDCRGMGGGAA